MARRLLNFPCRGYLFGHDPTEPLLEAEICSYPHLGTKIHIKGHTYTVAEVVMLTERELMYIHLEPDPADLPMDEALHKMHNFLDPGIRLA